MTQTKTALVTGAAGFIGAAVTERLLRDGWQVAGLDNLNSYYTPALKQARLVRLQALPKGENFSFEVLDLQERAALTALVQQVQPTVVIHLAAQAGVRYGLENPVAYLESNLIGHFNMLEACRVAGGVDHLLYASSSSVYGANETVPFSETHDVSRPQSLYAATKRADELITQAWCHQFQGHPGAFAATGLRFFTVYGPWGRPDMSPMIFARCILEGRPIPLFNSGDLWRDFTYIDDIVEAIVRLIPVVPGHSAGKAPHTGTQKTPHAVYNLGNQSPVQLREYIATLEQVLGRTALVENLPWPPTEVYRTYADTARLQEAVGWAPATLLAEGLARFGAWFREWHARNGAV